ncbi:alanyl-tRNA editing protein, partial [bacterium]
MGTEKLYWHDPFATTFVAAHARKGELGGRPSVVLERTLFYPEAGGQLADAGVLEIAGRTLVIDDVQIDHDGVVHHFSRDLTADVLADLPRSASADGVRGARGAIDAARRHDQMAHHTAQHVLSRALVDEAGADTVSARLGATSCTVDVARATIAEADLARAEDLANAVVRRDVVVSARFPTADELAAMPLRRAVKTDRFVGDVRVLDIEGFDLTPCGGTHCTRSGQIGAIRIAGVERYKGLLRITFHAAQRAVVDAREKSRV